MSDMLKKLSDEVKALRIAKKDGVVDPAMGPKMTTLQTLIGELETKARSKNAGAITDAVVFEKIAATLESAKANYPARQARGDDMFEFDVEIALLTSLMPTIASEAEVLAVIDEAIADNLPAVIKDRKVLNPLRGKIVAALNAKIGGGRYDTKRAAELAVERLNAVPLTE